MCMELRSLGYAGSYDRVAAFARAWHRGEHEKTKTASRGIFVPLVFAPGEAFQFDWSEDWAAIAGERTKLQVAQFKLSHSRARAAGLSATNCYKPTRCCSAPTTMPSECWAGWRASGLHRLL
jgi:hypothetical protein